METLHFLLFPVIHDRRSCKHRVLPTVQQGAVIFFHCGGSADLCAVLGNLLDNALEAAGQAEDDSRRSIWLTIRRINHMLVIKVQNTCEKQPVRENGEWMTTKEDKSLHGWGLKSAAAAVEK